MPKSTMTMSDNGSFVRYKIFSGLAKYAPFVRNGSLA
jgi:hypothetical protein